eukprot:38678-Amphidinium_carterae.1
MSLLQFQHTAKIGLRSKQHSTSSIWLVVVSSSTTTLGHSAAALVDAVQSSPVALSNLLAYRSN